MKNQDARISTRLTKRERDRVEQLVSEGRFRNLSDFLRISVIWFLEQGIAEDKAK